MHSLGIVQWNSTRRDHPGNPGGVSGSGLVMAWIELTVHWIVSDCGLGEVSGYTPSKGCVGLRVWITYGC